MFTFIMGALVTLLIVGAVWRLQERKNLQDRVRLLKRHPELASTVLDTKHLRATDPLNDRLDDPRLVRDANQHRKGGFY